MKTTGELEAISGEVELNRDDLRELKMLMMADGGPMHKVRHNSIYINVGKYQSLTGSF
jgi:hypothetical protein